MAKIYITQLVLLMNLIVLGASPSMAMEDKVDLSGAGISKLTSAPLKQDRNEVILDLMKQVQLLEDHEDDYFEQFQDSITEDVWVSLKKNRESNRRILSLLTDLKEKKLKEDYTLHELLMLRLSLINSARKNTQKFLEAIEKGEEVLYGPTDPKLFKTLNEQQKLLAIKAVDKYQTFNRIIIGLAKTIDLGGLNSKTRRLLQASSSLHPILLGQTNYLGRPDETFVIGENKEMIMRDWEYSRILNQSDTKYSSCELPTPEFLQRKLKQTPPIERDFLIDLQKQKVKPAKKKATKKGGKGKKGPRKPQKTSSVKIPNAPPTAEQTADVTLDKRKGMLDEKRPPAEDVEPQVIMKDKAPAAESPLDHSEEPPVKTVGEKGQLVEGTKSTVFDERRRPKGAIYSDASAQQNMTIELKGKIAKTHAAIFQKKYSPVKFKKFAVLWRHINGVDSINESGGGSHKELLDSKHTVIAGVFSHGDNQTIGQRSIKYIRDALIQIGYGE